MSIRVLGVPLIVAVDALNVEFVYRARVTEWRHVISGGDAAGLPPRRQGVS